LPVRRTAFGRNQNLLINHLRREDGNLDRRPTGSLCSDDVIAVPGSFAVSLVAVACAMAFALIVIAHVFFAPLQDTGAPAQLTAPVSPLDTLREPSGSQHRDTARIASRVVSFFSRDGRE